MKPIKFNLDIGEDISTAIEYSKKLSIERQRTVIFEFNGKSYTINEHIKQKFKLI